MEKQIGSGLVAALEAAYADVRERKPELPPVVFITGQGFDGRKKSRLGHYAHGAWNHRAGKAAAGVAELFIAGETLLLGPIETLGTILHEAVHALAAVRKVKDTSRGGRYHNRVFVQVAAELGLVYAGTEPHPVLGFSDVQPTKETLASYRPTLLDLKAALTAHRPPPPQKPEKKKSRNNAKATCPCDRVIRASRSTLEAGAIVCSLCGGAFVAESGEGSEDEGEGE